MNIVYGRFHLSGILTKLDYFLLLKIQSSFDPAKNTLNVTIHFASEGNRADKIDKTEKSHYSYLTRKKLMSSHFVV